MKSPDQNGQSRAAKLPSQICCPWELIGLDSDQADNLLFCPSPRTPTDLRDRYFLNGLVKEMNLQINIRSQHLAVRHILSQSRQTVQRVGGQHSSKMGDDIAVIIIVRRFY